MTRLTTTAEKPMNNETRPASDSRLSMSRPSVSVPRMYMRPSNELWPGASRLAARFCVYGS